MTNDIVETNKKEKIKLITQFTDKLNLAEKFIKEFPVYYTKAGLWYCWNKERFCWELTDETDILNVVDDLTTQNIIRLTDKSELINAIRQKARRNKPREAKLEWLQFKETIIDIKTNKKFKATSEYFFTNPIPHSLGKSTKTPFLDKIFEEWVGKDFILTLYEIIAYCLYRDYPLNRIFILFGEGLNGKTTFLKLIETLISKQNICTTELENLLHSRFERIRLHKKLACQMGETNFSQLKNTAILKQLSGNDLIGFEYKRSDLFEDKNYAKILIATNNLPTTDDKTIGFYRRMLILDFTGKFSEKKEILTKLPKNEINNLALKSVKILKKLLQKREFHNEGSIEMKSQRYEDKSNPFDKFLEEFTIENVNAYTFKFEFMKSLNDWLIKNKFRGMDIETIGKIMKEKEFHTIQRYGDWFENETPKQYRAWNGITLKSNPRYDKYQ